VFFDCVILITLIFISNSVPEEIPEIKNTEDIIAGDLIEMEVVTNYGGQEIVYRIIDAMRFDEGDFFISLEVDGSKSGISIHKNEITKDGGEGYVINHDGRTYLVRPPKLD
jgi:hypothetical protein